MLSVLLLAATLGAMLFFIVVVAPSVFKVLPMEWASPFLRRFFPRYYAVLGVTVLLAGLLAGNDLIRTIGLVCAGLFAFSLLMLTPAINKSSDDKNKRRFSLLHGASVLINFVQIVLLAYALYTTF